MQRLVINLSWLYYLKQHWFKATIISALLFLCIKRDFSFKINLSAPDLPKTTAPSPSQPTAPEQSTVAIQKEYFTEKGTQEQKINRFDLTAWSQSKKALAWQALSQVSEDQQQVYLKRFAHVAVKEMEKFEIPAPIILAQALLFSQAGTHTLARDSNNQFALTCTSDWQGGKITSSTECYRAYPSAWTSFRDNSYFLTSGARSHLRTLGKTNIKAWADAMADVYPNESQLSAHLLQIIETYGLSQLLD